MQLRAEFSAAQPAEHWLCLAFFEVCKLACMGMLFPQTHRRVVQTTFEQLSSWA